jgi:hypothetical protein
MYTIYTSTLPCTLTLHPILCLGLLALLLLLLLEPLLFSICLGYFVCLLVETKTVAHNLIRMNMSVEATESSERKLKPRKRRTGCKVSRKFWKVYGMK